MGTHLSDAPSSRLVLNRIEFPAISCGCKTPRNCAATLERGNEINQRLGRHGSRSTAGTISATIRHDFRRRGDISAHEVAIAAAGDKETGCEVVISTAVGAGRDMALSSNSAAGCEVAMSAASK